MTYRERKEKEQHILSLIEKERLICLEKVAQDYQCSKRTVERMIKELREEGNNIVFCRKRCKYFIDS
ncbi:HTH domain-containing protein [Tamlana sp. 62-3]|uniref:HTH domain-containing protein n=1 Tax=Neotamlana sargassicola TaxID=2883125 RepID=A0A9X1L484_9FLAO|nr:HTH domain-containing protein [Tamlana sargassicola]MCB4807937.1 HTH domain-containing protein [Tamlana sargassicola]